MERRRERFNQRSETNEEDGSQLELRDFFTPKTSWTDENSPVTEPVSFVGSQEAASLPKSKSKRKKGVANEEVVTVHVHHHASEQAEEIHSDHGQRINQTQEEDEAKVKNVEESYKERMRMKIRNVKAKAKAEMASTAKDGQTEILSYMREGMRNPKAPKKAQDEQEDLTRKKHLKDMWQKRVTKIIAEAKGKAKVSSEVSYDFFTRVWDDEDEEDAAVEQRVEDPERLSQRRTSTESQEHTVDVENLAEALQLLRKEYFDEDDMDWQIVKKSKAEYMPHAVRVAFDEELLFVPSNRPVPLGAKHLSPQVSENTEEETPPVVVVKPYIPFWNLHKIENRLVKYNEHHWFDESGNIKAIPLPIPVTSTRPLSMFEPPDDKMTIFRKPQPVIQFPEASSDRYSQLDVDVTTLVFLHHYLFNAEHVLASHLRVLYRKYSDLVERDVVVCLNQRLKACKDALSRHEVERDDLDTELAKKRGDVYRAQIRDVRQKKEQLESEQRSMLKSILSTWLELKNQRERQGYVSTSVHLTVTKETEDSEQAGTSRVDDYEERVEEELEVERERFQESYEEELEIYQQNLRRWKKWKKAKKRALKAQRKKKDKAEERGEDVPSEVDDQNILEEEEPEEPLPPDQFDEEAAKEEIRDRLSRVRRKKKQGKVNVELDESVDITPDVECTGKERKRRHEVSKISIGFQFYFNGKKICEPFFKPLTRDFSVCWGHILPIRIYNEPENLSVQIIEMTGSHKKLLSNIFLPIPEDHLTIENVDLTEMEFTSEHIVASRHNAVGSGTRIPSEVIGDQWLLTSGLFNCAIYWAMDDDGEILVPKSKRPLGILEKMKVKDQKSKDFPPSDVPLAKLFEDGQLDPDDPNNAALLESLRKSEGLDFDQGCEEETHFRLDPLMDSWDFVSKEELDNNARFCLIQLRAQEHHDFHNYQMIPAHEKDLPKDVLDAIWKTSADDDFVALSHKDRTLHLVNKVREQVMNSYLSAQHERTLEDIVVEEQIPSIGTLGFNLLQLTRRRRPLRPVRKERKKMTGQGITSTEVKIVVNVMRGMNVPVRSDPDTLKSTRRMSLVPFKADMAYESQTRPFVEIMFQRQTTRTYVADGPQPTWNEELHLSFKAPNDDYTPSNLEKVKDVIYLNLFDEVVVDLLEDDRERENTIHQKLERRWLGTLKIPFSTLYLNTKIEGTFQVDTPTVLLGYEQESKPWVMGRPETDTVSCATYLSLYFTLEPSLQLPELKDKTYKCENPFLRRAEEWQRQLSSRHHPRPIKAIALDLSGNWTFVTRYLRPLAPPEELLEYGVDNLETAELLARFVSLIPSKPDSVHPSIKCDIWLTCDQFLQVLTGDEEEHAILLCNFFVYLKKKAFLLLGTGIPEGETAYVLTNEANGEMWCWNATTGHHFNIRDSFCPLQRVGCVVSQDNIWTNIQKHDHPSRMNFNLNKPKDWQPFFHKKNLHPGFASVQPESLVYKSTNMRYVEELEEELNTVLKESIMRWRRRFRTTWNRYCNQVLRNVLPKLEINSGRTASLDSLEQLDPIIKSHKMCGFPLNVVFTDVEAVTEAVFATGVHLAEGKDLEFALAVYVHAYPCQVLAVWIYVATLEKR